MLRSTSLKTDSRPSFMLASLIAGLSLKLASLMLVVFRQNLLRDADTEAGHNSLIPLPALRITGEPSSLRSVLWSFFPPAVMHKFEK